MKLSYMAGLVLVGLALFVVSGGSDFLPAMHHGAAHISMLSAIGMAPALRGSVSPPALLRGIISARMDAADVAAEIRNMVQDITKKVAENHATTMKTFEDFKVANEAKFKDTTALDKINNALTDQGKELDKLNGQLAALKLGGANAAGGFDGKSTTPEQKAYREAFSGRNGFMRRGIEQGLRELGIKAATLITGDSDQDGGYTVTPEIETAITRIQPNSCAMRSLSQVMTIGTASYKKFVSIGGASSGWVDQRETRSATNTPQLVGLTFTAREMYAEPTTTQGALDDSFINIEQWLADEAGITFNEQEGLAFISGLDGAKQPMGLLSYNTVADASYAWGSLGYIGTGASNFGAADQGDTFNTLCYALKKSYRNGASWLMNRKSIGVVRTFKDTQHQYVWQPGLQAGQPATLLGYPVEDDDNMPDPASNAYPVAFGDFKRGYLIVDRVGIRVLRDPLTSKGNVIFYTTKRVGGGVQNFEAIKLMKCV